MLNSIKERDAVSVALVAGTGLRIGEGSSSANQYAPRRHVVRHFCGLQASKAIRAKSDRCYCPQFFVVEPVERKGNLVAPRLVTVNHGCV